MYIRIPVKNNAKYKNLKFILEEYKNPITNIEIKSSTTAKESKNIFKAGFNLFFSIIKIPTAKAISVEIGIPTPASNWVPLLNTINIIAGTITPPNAENIGKEAFLKLDKFPYSNSCFISSPTNKKNIAIKKSFTNICILKWPKNLNSPNR
ncbi:hypothetical protein UT300012_16560 [Paraclostridium bifermentans]